jgi:hypothetical protein
LYSNTHILLLFTVMCFDHQGEERVATTGTAATLLFNYQLLAVKAMEPGPPNCHERTT